MKSSWMTLLAVPGMCAVTTPLMARMEPQAEPTIVKAPVLQGHINFTGRADLDFCPTVLSDSAGVRRCSSLADPQGRYTLGFEDPQDMQYIVYDDGYKYLNSGNDIKHTYVFYHPGEDTLYVGIETVGITGDVEGDGDPSQATPAYGNTVDWEDFGGYECFGFYFASRQSATPQFMFGKSSEDHQAADKLPGAYQAASFDDSPNLPIDEAFGAPLDAKFIDEAPGAPSGKAIPSWDDKGQVEYTYASGAKPHLEFTIPHFSELFLESEGAFDPALEALLLNSGVFLGTPDGVGTGWQNVDQSLDSTNGQAPRMQGLVFDSPVGNISGTLHQVWPEDSAERAIGWPNPILRVTGDFDGSGSESVDFTVGTNGQFDVCRSLIAEGTTKGLSVVAESAVTRVDGGLDCLRMGTYTLEVVYDADDVFAEVVPHTGLSIGVQQRLGLDINLYPSDDDGDGLLDLVEIQNAEQLNGPGLRDTDGDGLNDYDDIDSDNDGITDGVESGLAGDKDPTTTTNYLDDDSDDDGLLDGTEDANHDGAVGESETDPNDFNTDGDCESDGQELGLVRPEGRNTDMDVFIADESPDTVFDPLNSDEANCKCTSLVCQYLLGGGGYGSCSVAPGNGSSRPGFGWAITLGFGMLGTLRRRASRKAVAATAAASALISVGTAQAQSATDSGLPVDTQQFHPTADNAGGVMTSGSSVLAPHTMSLGVWSNYANEPLVLHNADGSSETVQENVTALEMTGAVGLTDRLQVGVSLPVTVNQTLNMDTGLATDASTHAMGDLSARARLSLVDSSDGGLGVAVEPLVILPTGSAGNLTGGQAMAGASLLLDSRRGDHWTGLNIGYRQRLSPVVLGNVALGPDVTYRLGGGRNFGQTWLGLDLFGTVGLGIEGTTSDEIAASKEDPDLERNLLIATMPMEVMASASRSFDKWTGTVGLSTGLVAGIGTPDVRLVASVSWGAPRGAMRDSSDGAVAVADLSDLCPGQDEDYDSFEDEDGCPDLDNDKDGILDVNDDCPMVPEDMDGFEDEDGCPDLDNDKDGILDVSDGCPLIPEDLDGFEDEDGCPDVDNDKDGILDMSDECPLEPEDRDGFEDEDGCPDADNDKDGIADLKDGCPNTPENFNGIEDEDGCPEGDIDGDGILDRDDHCVTVPEDKDGFEDQDGCPDIDNDSDGILDVKDGCPMAPENFNGIEDQDGCPEKTLNESLQLDPIYFIVDSDTIRAISYPTLRRVVNELKTRAEVTVTIQGHTSLEADDDYNQALSERRAEAVRRYLVDNGIAASRLESIGRGEKYPVADEDAAAKQGAAALEEARQANRRIEFVVTCE